MQIKLGDIIVRHSLEKTYAEKELMTKIEKKEMSKVK